MNIKKVFVPPVPGQSAVFFCMRCGKNFSGEIQKPNIIDILRNKLSPKAKCPFCGKICGMNLGIRY